MGNHNSGRYKRMETIAKECEIEFTKRADKLWLALMDKAQQGNLEALIYIFDRQWGRPSQSLKAEITESATLNPIQLDTIRRMLVTIATPAINTDVKELGQGANGSGGDDSITRSINTLPVQPQSETEVL
jgi:hypothetical protein